MEAAANSCRPPVDFDGSDESIHSEICSLVCRWLSDRHYTATLQIFRDEINTHGKEDHSVKKAVRGISKAVEDGNWDAAYNACKKLEGVGGVSHRTDPTLLSLLLAKQHFLELVDEGDAQRAFTFFLRRIKPFEDRIGQKVFQQLTYLLTCRAVADAAPLYPDLRGWTPNASRAALLAWMANENDNTLSQPYTRDHRVAYSTNVSLEELLKQALSYQLLDALSSRSADEVSGAAKEVSSPSRLAEAPQHPICVSSVLTPLHLQMPPTQKQFSVLTGLKIRTMQPYLHKLAVAVGTVSGEVMWCELEPDNKSVRRESLAAHSGRVWSSDGTQELLVTCGGKTLLAYSVERRETVREVRTHGEPMAICIAVDGSMMAAGTSDGDVIISDLPTNDANTMGPNQVHRFDSFACTTVGFNLSGTILYAGFKDGVIRVMDTCASVVVRTLAPPIRAEVTALSLSPSSMSLLVAYKNNTLRVWNTVTGTLDEKRYGGHVNQSKAFVRATFGALDHHVFSASEDGNLCYWERRDAPNVSRSSSVSPMSTVTLDTRSSLCTPQERIHLHKSMITDVKVSGKLLVSCSEDGEVCICAPAGLTWGSPFLFSS